MEEVRVAMLKRGTLVEETAEDPDIKLECTFCMKSEGYISE